MPGMPEMMTMLPGTAASAYELIWGPLGGTCLCCFVDDSAQNRVEAFQDADTLVTFNDIFKKMIPFCVFIFPPAVIPYRCYSMAIDRFIEVHRDVALHFPKPLPFEGDYPHTWNWWHWFPDDPNPLIDTSPI